MITIVVDEPKMSGEKAGEVSRPAFRELQINNKLYGNKADSEK